MARKRQLRLGRWHFYASHLVEGERGEFSLKSDFSADPKFRSRKEIDDNALAPRGDSQVATPSAASRSILFFSSSSSSSSSSSPSVLKRKIGAEDRQDAAASAVPSTPAKRAKYFETQYFKIKEEVHRLKVENQRLQEAMSDMEEEERARREFECLPMSSLSFAKFVDDEKVPLKSYTGFSTPEQLEAFYDLLNYNGQCDRLKIWGTKRKSKRKHRTAMAPKDGLAFSLFVLRSGVSLKIASSLFRVSSSSGTRHFTTWILFLNRFLETEFPYPTADELQSTTRDRLREAFELDKAHFEAFIDCHEQQCETPTDLFAHQQVWSEYKQRTTLKFFGAISGNGAFTFVSTAFRGRVTDPVVTRLCGFLNVIHPGGIVGADKDFQMHADFSAKRSSLVIPPVALPGQKMFSFDQMAETSTIARERIHVERAFRRAQEFQILHRVIPLTMLDLWGPIFRVCCYLTNYGAPLINDKRPIL